MTTDLAIIGAGICGLWTAKFALEAGLSVTLIDKGAVGSGGSNGVLGALAPHLPDSSNEKKRFHWRALDELPLLIEQLEDEGGLSTGYGRTGRLMPVRVEGFQKRMQRCVEGAPEHWQIGKNSYDFEFVDVEPFAHWINPELAPLGLAFDNMSARVAPRSLTKALKASLVGPVNIIEGFAFGHFDEESGRVVSQDGRQVISTRNLVLAAGYETYPMLETLTGMALGEGTKGHSALLALAGVADLPALYDNGVYVVPHGDGTVAVGSSSQKLWADSHEVEEDQCVSFMGRAVELCPSLENAQVLTKWAGIRPRCFAKDPMVGQLEEGRNIYVLTGGFKISFGIAHRLARALVQQITGAKDAIDLPPSFEVVYHLAEAQEKA